jgi:hypothetical protein
MEMYVLISMEKLRLYAWYLRVDGDKSHSGVPRSTLRTHLERILRTHQQHEQTQCVIGTRTGRAAELHLRAMSRS